MTAELFTNKKLISKKCFGKTLKNFCTTIDAVLSFLSVSSLFIGGHGFFKTYISFLLLGMNPNITACAVVFLISFSVYSLDKIADMDKDITNMPQRHSFLYGRKKLVFVSAIAAYLAAIVLVLSSKPIALPIIFIPFIANAFYATKLHKDLPRLKDIPGIKNLVVALSWALVTTLVPAMYLTDQSIDIVGAVIYFLLIKTLVDNVLYDIRDIKGDAENGVRTMAVLLGKRKTVALLLVINSTLLPLLGFTGIADKTLALALTLYGCAYIIYFRERRNPIALDFFVEGEWMLMTALLLSAVRIGIEIS